jgi:hypothetical protein
MSDDKKDHILIPALLTAVAAYFGWKKSSESLGGITRTAVNMALNHQLNKIGSSKKQKYLALKKKRQRRRFR